MERLIFHVDVNSAFLSWEAASRVKAGEPDLREIPSAVGGDPRTRTGIIVAKSIPAKKYGVQTGEPVAMALRKCPNLVVVPSDFRLYTKNSQAFKAICKSYAPAMESFSIDEVFLDMTGTSLIYPDPIATACEIKDKIYQELGFTVNVGISTNKLLAKMASDFEKPNKVHTLFPDEIKKKMWPLPVRDLFFVGKSSEQKLYTLGIRTIGELAAFDPVILQSHMGKHGLLIYEYANGIDPSPVAPRTPENKGYGNSTTLPNDVTDSAEAKKILRRLCDKVASRLQKDEMRAFVVVVSIRDNEFHNVSHQCSMVSATNDPDTLYTHCCQLFDEIWDGSPIRLLGVSTSKLTKHAAEQLNLLDMPFIAASDAEEKATLSAKEYFQRQTKLDEAIQKIKTKYGNDAITKGI